ncbi:hypothetical protein FVEG_12975 [Fusarium verticillioides 7600]|uniref:Uncharacterized protein n=1 Tax=Gibberella moniliformis (strain M3125 / FGSC 7600) TaxID=334819 RepID=W7NF43_GIBM7|nr:hypothetical protein FVEG_12975 [Fusarium verticillioides 7600]EWG54872.1 hypothetical protein FVEG_12975 [Fusarium verticillioides 7600]
MSDSSSSLSSPPANPQIVGFLCEVISHLGNITTHLDAMNDPLNTLEATFRVHDQHLARIDRRLTSLTATTTNLHARALNSGACASSSALIPLVSPVTGAAILDFPRTYGEVQRLNARELGGLLRALNLRGARTAEQKRGDFIRAIGITKLARL